MSGVSARAVVALVVSALVATLAGAVVAAQPVAIGLLAGLAVIVRWPTATFLALLIACQEVAPTGSYGAAEFFLTFGSDLYKTTLLGFPVVAVAAVVALLAALGWSDGPGLSLRRSWPLLGLLGVVLAAALLQGAGFDTLVRLGLPYLLAVVGVCLAATTARQPGGWQLVNRVGAIGLVVMALGGVYFLVTTGGSVDGSGRTTLFYDSALPAVAGAVFIYGVVVAGRPSVRSAVVTLIAPVTIVLLSGRRSIWLAVVIVLAVLLIARYGRRVVRVVAIAGIGAGLAAALVPGVVNGIGSQIDVVQQTVQGSDADQGTEGHLDDVTLGIDYAKDTPFLGRGYDSPPLPGLFVQSEQLYVHNDALQVWLLYGPLAGGLMLTCMAAALVAGWRALRKPPVTALVGTSAVFLMIWPFAGMTAAFASTTYRWPVLLGMAIGAVLLRLDALRRDSREVLSNAKVLDASRA